MFKREKKVYLELTDAERRLVRMLSLIHIL